MEHSNETISSRDDLRVKLRESFDGKIVRKDLTKKIKEGANVPVYVLEFLLGQYRSSDEQKKSLPTGKVMFEYIPDNNCKKQQTED